MVQNMFEKLNKNEKRDLVKIALGGIIITGVLNDGHFTLSNIFLGQVASYIINIFINDIIKEFNKGNAVIEEPLDSKTNINDNKM